MTMHIFSLVYMISEKIYNKQNWKSSKHMSIWWVYHNRDQYFELNWIDRKKLEEIVCKTCQGILTINLSTYNWPKITVQIRHENSAIFCLKSTYQVAPTTFSENLQYTIVY